MYMSVVGSAVHRSAAVALEVQSAASLQEELDYLVVSASHSQVHRGVLVYFLIEDGLLCLDFFLDSFQVRIDDHFLEISDLRLVDSSESVRIGKVKIDAAAHVLEDGRFEKSFPEGLADCLGIGEVFRLQEEIVGAESGVHRQK
jgi:hypothetical protein